MLSTRQVAKFLGDQAARRPTLWVGAWQDVQDLRYPGAWVQARDPSGMTLWTGGSTRVLVDPPVGGFAIGDRIMNLPEDFILWGNTFIAPHAPDFTQGFAPGIYRVRAWWQTPTATAATDVWALTFSGVLNGADADLGPGQPTHGWRINGIGGNIAGEMAGRLRADYPWKVVLSAQTAMADADVLSLGVTIEPDVLFDAAGNVL